MFEKIKESLNNSKTTGSGMKDVLRFEAGNNYLVRLLPNVHDPENTILPYYSFGWESRATGQYVSAVSPLSFGERCPLNELRLKLYRGNESDKKLASLMRRTNQWLVNVYVVANPTDPSTEGQVKIMRFGKQLYKVIDEAISGDDAEDFGEYIFDLGDNGNNLRVKVEKNEGGYPTYVSSKFVKAGPIAGVTSKNMSSIYESAFDLGKVLTVKPYDELVKMIDAHLLNKSSTPAPDTGSDVDDDDDNLPGLESKKVDTKPIEESDNSSSDKDEDISDDDIDELLKDL